MWTKLECMESVDFKKTTVLCFAYLIVRSRGSESCASAPQQACTQTLWASFVFKYQLEIRIQHDENAFIVFSRVASCCVYYCNLFGGAVYRNSVCPNAFYYYYIPITCFGPYGPSSWGIYILVRGERIAKTTKNWYIYIYTIDNLNKNNK
jgi:hypothetical protein